MRMRDGKQCSMREVILPLKSEFLLRMYAVFLELVLQVTP